MDGRKRNNMKWALIWASIYLPNAEHYPNVTTVEMYNSKQECQSRQQQVVNVHLHSDGFKVTEYYAEDDSTTFLLKGIGSFEKNWTKSIKCIKLNYESK